MPYASGSQSDCLLHRYQADIGSAQGTSRERFG
jgi:hypothetical protein